MICFASCSSGSTFGVAISRTKSPITSKEFDRRVIPCDITFPTDCANALLADKVVITEFPKEICFFDMESTVLRMLLYIEAELVDVVATKFIIAWCLASYDLTKSENSAFPIPDDAVFSDFGCIPVILTISSAIIIAFLPYLIYVSLHFPIVKIH